MIRVFDHRSTAPGSVRAARADRIGVPQTMFGFLTPPTKDDTDPLVSARVGVRLAAALADPGRHRAAAPGHADLRRHAPVEPAGGPQSHRRHPVPGHRARRRPPPARQAVRREHRPFRAGRRPRLAGRAGDEPGLRLRVPDGARAGAGRELESALEAVDPAAFRAPAPLSRHRCQAPRVPARALDSREVDEPPPALCPRHRARRRPRRRSRSRAPGPARCSGAPSRNTSTRS